MRRFLRSPLTIATLTALVIVLVGVHDVLNHIYWNAAYKFYSKGHGEPVSVVVLDNGLNWTPDAKARLFRAIGQAKPSRVIIDTDLERSADASADSALARSVQGLGTSAILVARAQRVDRFERKDIRFPDPSIAGATPIAVSAWQSNIMLYGESSPYAFRFGERTYPALATVIGGRHAGLERSFYPDFSLDPESVERIAGSAVLHGAIAPSRLAQRQIIVSDFNRTMPIFYFSHQSQPAIMLDLAGAEGLAKPVSFAFGDILYLSPLPLMILTIVLVAAASRSRGRHKKGIYAVAVVLSLVVPVSVRSAGVIVVPGGAWLLMIAYACARLWQMRTRRIQQTSASGLPNLLALTNRSLEVGRDVVVAVVGRYEEILATLPRELHGEVAQQIARRISAGSGAEQIYHGEGGHFAWTEEARPLETQFGHLEGLRALFAAPLQIGQHTFDMNIRFGLDRNEGLDALTRVNSALASANEALANGRAVELFEAHRLSEAPWELSLHARIDEGLRNGDIWLAYQSQWDIAENRICGAEALIRWDHPMRGPIAPDAFILQAERAGRIDALTYWVLEQAITAALAFNAMGPRFQMSVNLSAQMVDKAELVTNFAEIVRRRGIEPSLLTIEVTETSSVRNRPAACHNLTRLREMGFRLSIDDFGTGEASLAYLADLPSDELKLDRRFVSRILASERDRAIVSSTIALAHALGQKVVAEGIEDAGTYHLLRELGCDHAQGFYLGRPVPFARFEADYAAALEARKRNV